MNDKPEMMRINYLKMIFLPVFFHNLRLVIQYERDLIQKVSSNKKISGGTFIKLLTTKAEMAAYDLIMQEHPSDYIDDIMKQHYKQVQQDMMQEKLIFPINRNLLGREKLDAVLRFVHAETMARSIQTICRCYLASSRLNVYEVLKSENITLSLNNFNRLNKEIDLWKEYNYITALREQNYVFTSDFATKEPVALQKNGKRKKGYILI